MPQGPGVTREQIAATSSLCVVGKSNKDISIQTGIALCTVQRWTKKCKAVGGDDPPLQFKRTGLARKTG
ncbi:hypothetical protein E2C01_023695 [Portunus trituberculatus]|uniref:HTH psq-type domain-containing protein n=1 Tax=Portunus trituberculatus TaxID=210409 RepID=A0A5B7E8N9_PORTR|nr:hypothetical protein [Portunus trituberculatus]